MTKPWRRLSVWTGSVGSRADFLSKCLLRLLENRGRSTLLRLVLLALKIKTTAKRKPEFKFDERTRLVDALFPSLVPSFEEQIQQSCEIIEAFASLCGKREYPRPRAWQKDDAVIDDSSSKVKECFLDTEPDTYPTRCPGTQCLFYLGDTKMEPRGKIRCFANPYSLTRHVQRYLQCIPPSESFPCSHPSCTPGGVLVIGYDAFKLQALQEHCIVHSA